MAYNNRMSMAGSQQHHNRTRKKEDDNDALMRLVSRALKLDAAGTVGAITDPIIAR
jgi:hypothetical protein